MEYHSNSAVSDVCDVRDYSLRFDSFLFHAFPLYMDHVLRVDGMTATIIGLVPIKFYPFDKAEEEAISAFSNQARRGVTEGESR